MSCGRLTVSPAVLPDCRAHTFALSPKRRYAPRALSWTYVAYGGNLRRSVGSSLSGYVRDNKLTLKELTDIFDIKDKIKIDVASSLRLAQRGVMVRVRVFCAVSLGFVVISHPQ